MGVVCQNSIAHWTTGDVERRCSAMILVLALLGALRAALRTRTDLTLENLALRQQLALLRRGACGSRAHHGARESALGRATHPR